MEFLVDITLENGERFMRKATFNTKDKLNELLLQTVSMLKEIPQLSEYAEDLEDLI